MVKVGISWDKTSPVVARLAVELAYYIGFETLCMEFPLVAGPNTANRQGKIFVLKENSAPGFNIECRGNEIEVSAGSDAGVFDALYYIAENYEQLTGCQSQKGREAAVEGFASSTANARPVAPFDNRSQKGLESLFEKDFILQDDNHDLLPDRVNLCICLPKVASCEQVTAACHIAARFGMETTAIHQPITAPKIGGSTLSFEVSDKISLKMVEENAPYAFLLQGDGPDLVAFSCWLCQNFPLEQPGIRWVSLLETISQAFQMQNLDGQLAWLVAHKGEAAEGARGLFSPKVELLSEEIRQYFAPVQLQNHLGHRVVFEKVFDIPWEVDRFRQLLEEKVWPFVKAGDELELDGALSEEIGPRTALVEEFKRKATALGATVKQASVWCAYKQGYSWLQESVLPQLKQLKGLAEITIAVAPFQKDKGAPWDTVDGAVPTHDNVGGQDEKKWCDFPIRYLQELYPADDMLAEGLGIERDNIKLAIYDGTEPLTYLVTATGADGQQLLQLRYTASYSERPYLDAFPKMGLVHPSTGYLRVVANGAVLADFTVKTDLEMVWDIYQQEILPACGDYCVKKCGGQMEALMQPFFSQLVLQLTLSEPDFNLPSRQDRISSLDALHEDIYFAGLDYFKTLGLSSIEEMLDAPGLILPVVRKGEGAPSFKVTLYDHLADQPELRLSPQSVMAPAKEPPPLFITELLFEEGQPTVIIQLPEKGWVADIATAFTTLGKRGWLSVAKDVAHAQKWVFQSSKVVTSFTVKSKGLTPKKGDIKKIDLMEKDFIGYEDYLTIIEQLKAVPDIDVYKIAESFEGRDLYAIELRPKCKGYLSQTKRINRHPVEFINTRHHANEISGTNAAFILLKELLTNPAYEELAEEMSLIIVPMENVDGTHIHQQLYKDNPQWKAHAARFNATGKEFSLEYFNSKTRHTEALGLTRVWQRFLPDVAVDNHGVPKHEWDQQFSGYTSPSYKGFWLPRSLLYGYFWYVQDEEFKENYTLNKQFEDVVAEAMAAHEETTRWNDEWQNRFETYAHRWMPKMFPADYYKGMINYWVPFNYDASHRYSSVRYPWITSVAYTSEVADETATGDYLNLCARAHVCHDLAIIEMVRRSRSVFSHKLSRTEEGYTTEYIRQRPLIADL